MDGTFVFCWCAGAAGDSVAGNNAGLCSVWVWATVVWRGEQRQGRRGVTLGVLGG